MADTAAKQVRLVPGEEDPVKLWDKIHYLEDELHKKRMQLFHLGKKEGGDSHLHSASSDDGGVEVGAGTKRPRHLTGTCRTQQYVHATKFSTALAEEFPSELDLIVGASDFFQRNLGILGEVLDRVQVPVPGTKKKKEPYLERKRNEVVEAQERALQPQLAMHANMLGASSTSGFIRLTRCLFSTVITGTDKKGKLFMATVPKTVRLEDGGESRMPRIPGRKAFEKLKTSTLKYRGLAESDDHLAVVGDVVVAIQEAIRAAIKDQDEMVEEHVRCEEREIDLGGDAAHIFRGVDGTTFACADTSRPWVGTQNPWRSQDFLYFIGKDDYEQFKKYGSAVFDKLREIKKNGLDVDGRHHKIRFVNSDDWHGHRSMLGLVPEPTCVGPCWLCDIHKDDLGTSEDCAPLRDMREACFRAHCNVPGEPWPVGGIRCDICKKGWLTEEDLAAENLTPAQQKAHHRKHHSQVWRQTPLLIGIVDDIMDNVICLLHGMINGVDIMRELSIVLPIQAYDDLIAEINVLIVEEKMRIPKVKKLPPGATFKPGKGGIGGEVVRHFLHFKALLKVAWSTKYCAPGDAAKRLRDLGLWEEGWEIFIELIDVQKLQGETDEEEGMLCDLTQVLASSWSLQVKTATADEFMRIYGHLFEIHLARMRRRHGNMLRLAQERIEHGNKVKRKIAATRSNRNKVGNAKRDGTFGRGLACQVELGAIFLTEAHRSELGKMFASTKSYDKRIQLLYERSKQARVTLERLRGEYAKAAAQK